MKDSPVLGWTLPVDTPIQPLFEWCLGEHAVNRLLLSARLDREEKQVTLAKPEIETVLASTFAGKILERRLTARWPGTELIGHLVWSLRSSSMGS